MSIGMSILYGGLHTDTFIYFPPFLIPVRTCRDISPIGLGARRVYTVNLLPGTWLSDILYENMHCPKNNLNLRIKSVSAKVGADARLGIR